MMVDIPACRSRIVVTRRRELGEIPTVETQRLWFKSASTAGWPLAKVRGVWPGNDACPILAASCRSGENRRFVVFRTQSRRNAGLQNPEESVECPVDPSLRMHGKRIAAPIDCRRLSELKRMTP